MATHRPSQKGCLDMPTCCCTQTLTWRVLHSACMLLPAGPHMGVGGRGGHHFGEDAGDHELTGSQLPVRVALFDCALAKPVLAGLIQWELQKRKSLFFLLQGKCCCGQQLPCHDDSSACWPHAMLPGACWHGRQAECTCGIDVNKQVCLCTSPAPICKGAVAGADHSGPVIT